MRYHKLGKIPSKRHTVFDRPGGGLYYEQLFGTEGFSGMSSLLYHLNPPTRILSIGDTLDVTPEIAVDHNMTPRKFVGYNVPPVDDYLESRTTLMLNSDLTVVVAAPRKSMTEYFYKNGEADEMIFVHKGSGTLHTLLGSIPFEYGDYLIIPRGMIYQMEFDNEDNRLLIVESFSPIYTPNRYRNEFGQMLEHSPFCERDFKLPQDLVTHDEEGQFLMKVKKANRLHQFTYANHPFDVVGWDGYSYPWAFSIHNFEPITGRVHLPPPIHQTFEGRNFVICSFVPRLYDYHPNAIPAPYAHSNIDSDELLYYVDGDFMSRNDIGPGVMTLHPGGLAHGPHPGAVERSIGQTETNELAVMIDPFRPLQLTVAAMEIAEDNYYQSWMAPARQT